MALVKKITYLFCFLFVGLFLSKNLLSQCPYKWFAYEHHDLYDFKKENNITFSQVEKILGLKQAVPSRLSLEYFEMARSKFREKCDEEFKRPNLENLNKNIDALNLALNRIFKKVCEDTLDFTEIQRYMGWL